MTRIWSSRRGTSLVEVLVVMVVLLVGIMTVIQMFPTGFRVVKAAESQTIATRLGQQELERWKNMAANLPDGILPIDETGTVLNTQLPGPPFEGWYEDPGNPGAYIRGSALNTRQVYGETTTIPTASYFETIIGTQYGSRYTLAFGPVDVVLVGSTLDGLDIRSGDLRRRTGDKDHSPPYLRPGQYAIDYGEDTAGVFYLAFPKNTAGSPALYKVSYSYWAEDSGDAILKSVASQDVSVSADYDGDWIEVPADPGSGSPPPGFIELDRNSDTCARGFRFLDPADPWPNDPYTFKLADFILGVIAFNPAAHGLYEYTARGIRPIVAKIDYRISDIRIIREDRVAPPAGASATEIPIKLSLRFILNAGDPSDLNDGDPTDNPNEPTYEGLVRDRAGQVVVPLSVLVMDIATGMRVDLPANSVDFVPGVVRLPVTADLVNYDGDVEATVPLAGRHLRFFYRADGDWSIQCTKAYTAYTRNWTAGTPDYRSFQRRDANRLLFAKCEVGKTVVVDYTYFTPDGAEHKVVGESHQVDVARDGSNDICIDLDLPADGTIRSNARITVVGTSFTARVVWRDGKRWRYVDMDTNLTQTSP